MNNQIDLHEIENLIINAYAATGIEHPSESTQQSDLIKSFQQKNYRQMALILEQVGDYLLKSNFVENAVITYQNAIHCLSFDSQEQHLAENPLVKDFDTNLKEFEAESSYWAPDLFLLDDLRSISNNENNLCLRLLLKAGSTYLLKTQKEPARKFYTRALSIINLEHPDTLELYAMLLANRAMLTLHTAKIVDQHSETDLLEAIKIFSSTGNHRNVAKARSILASIERDVKKNYPEAERLYKQTIEFYLQNQSDIRGLVRSYIGLGVLQVFEKQYNEAVRSFYSALLYEGEFKQIQNLWWPVYWGLGSCSLAEKKYAEAQKYFEKSLDFIEIFQNNLISDEGKVTFIESVQHVYNPLLDTLVGQYNNNESLIPILDLMEKMRGQSFKDIYSGYNNLAANPIHRLLFQLQPNYTIVLFVDARGPISGHILPLCEEWWASVTAQFQQGIGSELFSRDTTDSISSPVNMDTLFQSLYLSLLKPIEKKLPPPGEQILIEPDGALWQLPLHLFQNEAGKYVAEIWPVTYCASFEVYNMLKNRHPIEHTPNNPSFFFAAVGVNQKIEHYDEFQALPYAVEEVKSIVKILNLPLTNLYLNEACTKTVIEEKISDSRVVHLATHGQAYPENPMSSFIVLFGQNEQNALLSAEMVKKLRLNNCEMLVLSACKSGLGKIMSEGMIGLARAFLIAGANSVLVSLWSVQDQSTQLLMESFYRHLLQGQNKSIALQKAMLELKEKEKTMMPKYWAPFILIGDEAPLIFN